MAIGILVMFALALAFVLFFNFARGRILAEKNRRQNLQLQHQQELLHSTILTQERERKRIAKELHDEIGSKLNVIHLNMHRLRKLAGQNEGVDQTIQEVNDLIHTTIGTTRRISHDLLPPTLEDFGLGVAVKELAENYNKSGQVLINEHFPHMNFRLKDVQSELHLFRILQELIANSIKHGQAAEIQIELLMPEDSSHILLSYQDNGKGFDIDQSQSKGLGLKNLQSRTNMISAIMDINSSPGEGIQVRIQIPKTLLPKADVLTTA